MVGIKAIISLLSRWNTFISITKNITGFKNEKEECWLIAAQNENEDLSLIVLTLACLFLKLKDVQQSILFTLANIQVLFLLDLEA